MLSIALIALGVVLLGLGLAGLFSGGTSSGTADTLADTIKEPVPSGSFRNVLDSALKATSSLGGELSESLPVDVTNPAGGNGGFLNSVGLPFTIVGGVLLLGGVGLLIAVILKKKKKSGEEAERF